jgi:hypothetical protein
MLRFWGEMDMNLSLVHVRAGLLMSSVTAFDPVWIMKKVSECSEGQFEQNKAKITTFPDGIEAMLPPEVTRLVVSNNHGITVEVSKKRIDVLLQQSNPAGSISGDKIDEFKKMVPDFLEKLSGEMPVIVNRLSFITERTTAEEESPASFITKNFLHQDKTKEDGPFTNSEESQVHHLKKYTLCDMEVFSWVRLRSLKVKVDDKETPLLSVLNDINTVPNPTIQFEPAQIKIFFSNVFKENTEIIKKYFGEEEDGL